MPVSISNGSLEGLNIKNKNMKRQAYGFRDREYFKLQILGSRGIGKYFWAEQ